MTHDGPYDVAVVGYGPVGQLLTLKLARAGLDVIVIERWPALFQMPRAVHFDHEVARILQSAGVGEKISEIIISPTSAEYVDAHGEVLMRSNVFDQPSPSAWPFANGFAQPELEKILDDAVRIHPNVRLMRGWAAHSLRQTQESVELGIQCGGSTTGDWIANGGATSITARYVVGTDGANSTIRALLGVGVTDLGFASNWLVVNLKWKPGRERETGLVQTLDPARPTTVVPGGRGRRRYEFMLVEGEDSDTMNDAGVAWSLLAKHNVTPDDADLERHAVYTFRARWADEWRVNRVFLAGDAAHQMPPFMAQGMCSGMRDVAALSWRLPLVIQHRASPALFDSYAAERLPHVRELIQNSVGLGMMICITDPAAAAQRDQMLLAALKDPSLKPPPIEAPRLGRGLLMDGDLCAGTLGFQAVVNAGGRSGRFDDVVGNGFTLVGTQFDPAPHLSTENRRWFEQELGGSIAFVDAAGDVQDPAGAYRAWTTGRGLGAFLSRPDFYLFGGARQPTDVEGLVSTLRRKLEFI